MYEDNLSPAPGVEVYVEPDLLDQQANRFISLGDDLRGRANAEAVQPLQLGSAPPAMKFAERLAALAGFEGATGALLGWATGLNTLGETHSAAARDYRATEHGNLDTLRNAAGEL